MIDMHGSHSDAQPPRYYSYGESAGIAAWMLAEATLLALVNKGVLTQAEAKEAIRNAMVKADQEAEVFNGSVPDNHNAITNCRQFLEGLMGSDDLRGSQTEEGSDQ